MGRGGEGGREVKIKIECRKRILNENRKEK